MKKKTLGLALLLSVFNYYIEKTIFYIKNARYKNFEKQREGEEIPLKELEEEESEHKTIKGKVLENTIETILINLGRVNGIKKNQIVKGEFGFIGIVSEVQENIALIKTFWNPGCSFIIANGKNTYGQLTSKGGFSLKIKNKNWESNFTKEDSLYIFILNKPPVFFGKIGVLKSLEPIPAEDITKIKEVYIIK